MSTNEQTPQHEAVNAANSQIFEQLTARENTETHVIGQYGPSTFDIEGQEPLGVAINQNDAIKQELHAVVNAGGELFGVVRAKTVDSQDPNHAAEGFVLTRFAEPGKRATIIGSLEPGTPLTIGRKHQEGLSPTTSGEHFMLGINDEGKLVMEDLGSTNGTELLIGKGNTHADVIDPKNPLGDFAVWAPKSANVKAEVNQQRSVQNARNLRSKTGGTNMPQSNQGTELISEVPKTAEEAKAMADEAEAGKQAAKEAMRAEKETILSDKLKQLEEPFDEAERHNLWAYAAGIMNKREAQAQGYGAGSIAHEQEAGQAYRKLSPAGQSVAGQYLQLMQELNRVRSS